MVVKLFLFLVLGAQRALSEEYANLELNLLNNKSVYSSELNFVNSRVYTHDVNPGYTVKKVTQGGLTVWESKKHGENATNAVLVFGEYLPKLVSLVVSTAENESQLLYFVYTPDGWVNLNHVNVTSKKLLETKEETKSPLHLTNGEQYFNKTPSEKDEEVEEVDLDLENGVDTKFDFKFSYTLNKYVYFYTPRRGVSVKSIREGKSDIWKTKRGQLVLQIVAEKASGVFTSLKVSYLEFDESKECSFVKQDDQWTLSTPEVQHPRKKAKLELENRNLGELVKPVKKLVFLDLNELPEPPYCRKCTFPIEGVVHNVIYLSSETNVKRVLDGKTKVFDVPDDRFLSNGCFYTKNEEIVLVDLVTFKGTDIVTQYFQKDKDEYTSLTYDQFRHALKRFKEVEVIVDISTTKEGYTESSYSRLDFEYHVFRPSEGYVFKKVQEENLPIFESSTPLIDVVVHYFKGQKMLLDIGVQSPTLGREFFTYSKQQQKWLRVSGDFYHTLMDEFSKDSPVRYPSLDVLNQKGNEFVQVIDNKLLGYYEYIPRNDVEINAVYEGKNMIWTSRFENEKLTFLWYHPNRNLVYVNSRDSSKLRQYPYLKMGEKWKSFSQPEFSKLFNFIYSKNLTVDISKEFDQNVEVEANGNSFFVKPRPGYLISRIRYGYRVIWIGTQEIKCESFKIHYGLWETYMHMDLVNSNSQSFKRYLKTVNQSFNSWTLCQPLPELEDKFKPQSEKDKLKEKEKKLEENFVKQYANESVSKSEKTTETSNYENMQLVPFKVTAAKQTKPNVVENKPETKVENKTENKVDNKPETKVEPKNDQKVENKTQTESVGEKTSEVKDESKPDKSKKVTLSGDYLVITEVKTANTPPVDTELSTDTTQEINGFKVGQKSSLVYNHQLFNKSNTPNSLRDLKVNKAVQPDNKPLLALPLEPYNKEEESKTSEDVSKSKVDELKEEKEPNVSAPKVPTKLVNYKKTDPSGKYKPKTKERETVSHTKKEPRGVKSDDLPINRLYGAKNTPKPQTSYDTNNGKNTQNYPESKTVSSVATSASSLTSAPEVKDKFESNNNKSQLPVNCDGFPSSPQNVKDNKSQPNSNQPKSYADGVLSLQDLSSLYLLTPSATKYGEFRDCRPQGFDFLLYTPKPDYPIRRLQDAFQTIWTSSREECLALSVFLENGLPRSVELFVRDLADVRRKFYKLDEFKWKEVTSEEYDALTSKK